MGFVSAIGRLAAVAVLAAAFLFGMAAVVYMSLQGEELHVPDVVGKGLSDSEKELASLGLKIKKRADRFSNEAPNTVIEQLPKPGETVKTGQLILVVTSKGPGGSDLPSSLKQTSEEDDAERIEEMLSDKPKKKTNTNTNRKKADTARDVNAAPANDNSNSSDTNSNKKEPGKSDDGGDKPKANTQTSTRSTTPAPRPGEARTRPTPKP